jgi:FAD synthase
MSNFKTFYDDLHFVSVPSRKDPSVTVKARHYILEPQARPTGIVYGSFAPWHYGHQLLLELARSKLGAANAWIVTPKKTFSPSDRKYIFTMPQATSIIRHINPNQKVVVVTSGFPPLAAFELIETHHVRRPVFVVGQDRETDFRKYAIPYSPTNRAVTDPGDPSYARFEMLVAPRSRESQNEISGTRAREALKRRDYASWAKTMQSLANRELFDLEVGYLEKNGVIRPVA